MKNHNSPEYRAFVDELAKALLATLGLVENPRQQADRLFNDDYSKNSSGGF